jgi:hypothetical protein
MFQKNNIVCDIEGCTSSMNILSTDCQGWRWLYGKYHICKSCIVKFADPNYKPKFKAWSK